MAGKRKDRKFERRPKIHAHRSVRRYDGTIQESFNLAVDRLKRDVPLNAPIKVTRGIVADNNWGDCYWDSKRSTYIIRISNKLRWPGMITTLIHEWAHALVWDKQKRKKSKIDHDDDFWITLGRVSRIYDQED